MATLIGSGTINVAELIKRSKDVDMIYICYNVDKPSRIIKSNGEDITDEVYHDDKSQ